MLLLAKCYPAKRYMTKYQQAKRSCAQLGLYVCNVCIMCTVQVPKAASTSWLYAFLKMANVLEDEIPEVIFPTVQYNTVQYSTVKYSKVQ